MAGAPPLIGQLGWQAPSTGGVEPTSPPAPGGYAALNQQLYSPADRQSFIASNRRRLFTKTAPVVVALSSSNTGNAIVTLQDLPTQGDGYLFEYMAGLVSTVDVTGHLTIVDTAVQVGNGSNLFLPLGTPQPTTLIPRVGTSLIFLPTPLLTTKDLDEWSRLAGFGSIFGAVSPLTVQLSVSMVNNDGAASHNFTVSFWLAYRFINGLTGA
jgi:hypothetical protein